jgi:hypothetical protein
MKNTFEEANHAHCFNHTLQLLAKALLKPFNIGISLTMVASEEEALNDIRNKVMTIYNKDTGNNEAGDDDDGEEDLDSSSEDLDEDDKPDPTTDELDELDEQEQEKVLEDTAVV